MTRAPPSRAPADPAPPLEHRGPGAGVLVMLHAAGSSPRALDRFARQLVPGLARTVAPIVAVGEGGIARAARHVVALLGSIPDRPRILFGHSMGGLLALEALACGAIVDALVLYEPIVLSLLDPADPGDRAARAWDLDVITRFRQSLAAGDAEAAVAGFVEAYGGTAWSAIPAGARADLVREAAALLAAAEATHAAPLDTAPLARIAVPTLILTGDRSPDVTRRMAGCLSARIPVAERIMVPGAGHMGPVAAAADVASAIAAFLARHAVRRESPASKPAQ